MYGEGLRWQPTGSSNGKPVVETAEVRAVQPAHGEMPFVRFLVIGAGLGLLSLVLIRLWQGKWWFPVGLDATTPEFATYWLGLLYVEWIVIISTAILGFIVLSQTLFALCRSEKRVGAH